MSSSSSEEDDDDDDDDSELIVRSISKTFCFFGFGCSPGSERPQAEGSGESFSEEEAEFSWEDERISSTSASISSLERRDELIWIQEYGSSKKKGMFNYTFQP